MSVITLLIPYASHGESVDHHTSTDGYPSQELKCPRWQLRWILPRNEDDVNTPVHTPLWMYPRALYEQGQAAVVAGPMTLIEGQRSDENFCEYQIDRTLDRIHTAISGIPLVYLTSADPITDAFKLTSTHPVQVWLKGNLTQQNIENPWIRKTNQLAAYTLRILPNVAQIKLILDPDGHHFHAQNNFFRNAQKSPQSRTQYCTIGTADCLGGESNAYDSLAEPKVTNEPLLTSLKAVLNRPNTSRLRWILDVSAALWLPYTLEDQFQVEQPIVESLLETSCDSLTWAKWGEKQQVRFNRSNGAWRPIRFRCILSNNVWHLAWDGDVERSLLWEVSVYHQSKDQLMRPLGWHARGMDEQRNQDHWQWTASDREEREYTQRVWWSGFTSWDAALKPYQDARLLDTGQQVSLSASLNTLKTLVDPDRWLSSFKESYPFKNVRGSPPMALNWKSTPADRCVQYQGDQWLLCKELNQLVPVITALPYISGRTEPLTQLPSALEIILQLIGDQTHLEPILWSPPRGHLETLNLIPQPLQYLGVLVHDQGQVYPLSLEGIEKFDPSRSVLTQLQPVPPYSVWFSLNDKKVQPNQYIPTSNHTVTLAWSWVKDQNSWVIRWKVGDNKIWPYWIKKQHNNGKNDPLFNHEVDGASPTLLWILFRQMVTTVKAVRWPSAELAWWPVTLRKNVHFIGNIGQMFAQNDSRFTQWSSGEGGVLRMQTKKRPSDWWTYPSIFPDLEQGCTTQALQSLILPTGDLLLPSAHSLTRTVIINDRLIENSDHLQSVILEGRFGMYQRHVVRMSDQTKVIVTYQQRQGLIPQSEKKQWCKWIRQVQMAESAVAPTVPLRDPFSDP